MEPHETRMTNLFCFGLGYCASTLARRLRPAGWTVSGTARTPNGVARIAAGGDRAILFDGTAPSPEVAAALRDATHVLLSIPPGNSGDPALRWHGNDIADSPNLRWIGYFSTVGVYGDTAGGWVNEETEARPGSERGRRRLAAEHAWMRLGRDSGKTVAVFRLPGIYGPGRSVLDDLRDGTARRLVKPGQVFNRIHVEDIASAVDAAIANPQSEVYNVVDDFPAPPQDVIAYGAELLGLPCPPDIDFATAELTPMARGFYSESKRVSNARMKQQLGLSLAYPTYREGLAAIARQELHQ